MGAPACIFLDRLSKCSSFCLFKQLILEEINALAEQNKIDQKLGFEEGHRMSSAMAEQINKRKKELLESKIQDMKDGYREILLLEE